MSATETLQTAGDKAYEEVRKAWHAANVRPLWIICSKVGQG